MNKALRARSLQDLAPLREALRAREAEAARARAAQQAEQQAEQQRLELARTAFARAVGPVRPLSAHGRVHGHADERAALREALSDEVDVESLLLTDDGLSFRRRGIALDVLTRLRRGQWAIQAQIDLHGLRRDEAREQLGDFVRQALQRGQRCVRVVHGKGLGSPGREPVLKAKVQRWLAQRLEVIAFTQATAAEGGAGALIVLLERRSAAR